jgi:hypothetical protein
MQRSDIELSGIQFPQSIRDEGASVEILQLDARKSIATRDIENWITENSKGSENPWRIISHAKSKEESMLLVLSERKTISTRYKIQSGRLTKIQEETSEPEVGEIHLRRSGLLELYSVPAKQKRGALTSLADFFGGSEDTLSPLYFEKDAMMTLMEEASDVTSVSLSGIGNPFFSDITLSGPDPINSRTFKELAPSAAIKSFKAKLGSANESEEGPDMMRVTVNNSGKVRFYGGRSPIPQASIEDYLTRVRKVATTATSDGSRD